MRALTHLGTKTAAAFITTAVLVVLTLSGCGAHSHANSGAQEQRRTFQGYDQLVAREPSHSMSYSPTRATINFWIDTWNHPNKLSYVYLQNASGRITGYYVLKGLPVSYCAALTPTQHINDQFEGPVIVNNPSVDGVYYSGGQCNTYYGEDASTGAYVEYTAGLGINVLLFDQPLPGSKAGNATPLGPTTIADVKGKH